MPEIINIYIYIYECIHIYICKIISVYIYDVTSAQFDDFFNKVTSGGYLSLSYFKNVFGTYYVLDTLLAAGYTESNRSDSYLCGAQPC